MAWHLAKQALKSYQRVLGKYKPDGSPIRYGLLSGNEKDYDADYLFSTMQMMSKEDVMENIVKNEGYDYQKYSKESQGLISSCVSVAVSVKSVLDTPLLTDDGLLTDESEETVANIETFLKNVEINY